MANAADYLAKAEAIASQIVPEDAAVVPEHTLIWATVALTYAVMSVAVELGVPPPSPADPGTPQHPGQAAMFGTEAQPYS